MWESSLQSVVGAKDVNVHHGLESIDRELVDRSKEIACRTSTGGAYGCEQAS